MRTQPGRDLRRFNHPRQLVEMAGRHNSVLDELMPIRLGYGDIEGSPRLKNAITALYKKQKPENVLVCHGTIGANALVHQALVSSGDHVIAVVPTYQQHYSIPESIGAEVTPLKLRRRRRLAAGLRRTEGAGAAGYETDRHQQPEITRPAR